MSSKAQQQQPSLLRKSSGPWERLRPAKQDPLESMGFVSKGDDRLLDIKVQENFYHKIVARYMAFCSRHNKDLDAAFAALTVECTTSASADPTSNPPTTRLSDSTNTQKSSLLSSKYAVPSSKATQPPPPPTTTPSPADEMSAILTALRKLREGLLASSSRASSPLFSQRVHVFNIRLAILAMHPPSYQSSITYLLNVLHTKEYPLPNTELNEMTTYLILDLALRRKDLMAAYSVKYSSQQTFAYENADVDLILKAVVSCNWVAFWKIRRKVDGYVRALIHWQIEDVRRSTLKAFARAYLKVDLDWLLQSSSGRELTWDALVEKEQVGWKRDGSTIFLRKPKSKP